MMFYRWKVISVAILSIFVITGCGTTNSEEPEQDLIVEEELQQEEEATPSEVEELKEQTESVTHIHGLAIDPLSPNSLLVATHHGLVRIEGDGQAFYIGESRDDFMGFSRVGNTEMLMTSGHPGHDSELPDPLGFLWSEDGGISWEIRSLLGEYDFHALTASYQNPDHIVGWALDYGSDFQSKILRSLDAGYTWEQVEVSGLPLGHHDLYNIAFSPNNNEILYAATSQGLFISTDNGQIWSNVMDGVITALFVIDNEEVIYFDAQKEELIHLTNGEKTMIPFDATLYGVVNYIKKNDANIHVTTMQNSVVTTNNIGETWKALIENGKVLK